jgi:hypothetical protein
MLSKFAEALYRPLMSAHQTMAGAMVVRKKIK